MQRLALWIALVLALSLPLIACNGDSDGNGDPGPADTSTDQTTEVATNDGSQPDGVADATVDTGPADDEDCWVPPTGDQLGVEGLAEFEFPDCLNGCPRGWLDISGSIVNLRTLDGDGFYGVIDEPSETHTWPAQGIAIGPDYDIIAVNADARTMIEVVVEPADGSLLNPVVFVSDGSMNLVYNDDAASTTPSARVVLSYPFINDLPIFIDITDAHNYEVFGTAQAEYVGGENYDYNVYFRTFEFAPVELGTLGDGVVDLSATAQEIACASDLTYYRFYAPATSDVTVSFTRTSGDDFIGFVAGMKTIEGQMGWTQYLTDDTVNPTGQITIDESFFEVCFSDCGLVPGEFVFGVSEWWGVPFPGADFTYDIGITLDD